MYSPCIRHIKSKPDENPQPENTDPQNTDLENPRHEKTKPEKTEPQNTDAENPDPENLAILCNLACTIRILRSKKLVRGGLEPCSDNCVLKISRA